MPGVGNTQIIQGVPYEMYTPAWYAAQKQNEVSVAQTAGQATGTGLAALQKAANLPLLGSSSGSSSASGSNAAFPAVAPLSSASGTGSLTGLNSAAGTAPSGGSGSPVAGPQAPDTTAANAATFAAAKDQAGQTARGALTGLRDSLGERGMLGGGVEGAATQNVVNTATQGVNNQTRQNAVTDAANSEQNALAGYSGQVAMRGQDITAGTAAHATDTNAALTQRAQDITQRGQNISVAQGQAAQQQAALQGLLSVLNTSSTGVLY